MKVLAIIPARKNSKGIVNKNIQKLGNKTLIEHTILSAQKSKKIDKILVSTDSSEISKIASSLGIEVPFIRPKYLSRDSSQTIDVIKHSLKYLEKENYVPDIICLLQPTSPFKNNSLIDESINLLIHSNATSVVTVSKIKTHPYASFWLKQNFLKPYMSKFEKYSRRQTVPDLYFPTGAVYTFSLSTLKKYDSIYGSKIKPLIISNEEKLDIDELFDLFIAEMKLLYWNDYKKNFNDCLKK